MKKYVADLTDTSANRATTAREWFPRNAKPFLALTFLLLFAALAPAADEVAQLKPPQHVRNFGEVNQNLLRGGLPTEEALRELKAFGVGIILDLREDGPGGAHEKQVAEKLGIRYERIPLSSFSAPSPDDI